MGRDPTEPVTPDLFSPDTARRDASAQPPVPNEPTAENRPQRHVLPKNLRHAVTQLSDGELDELVEVAFDEAKRRDRLPRSIRTDLTRSAHQRIQREARQPLRGL
jgi:hypothetical protein